MNPSLRQIVAQELQAYSVNHTEICKFHLGVADLIRDTFKRGKYQDVILPLTCCVGSIAC